jgi:hypothetical protein
MDGMDVMDGVDPEGEALHLMRAVRFVSSLLSPFSSLASGPPAQPRSAVASRSSANCRR